MQDFPLQPRRNTDLGDEKLGAVPVVGRLVLDLFPDAREQRRGLYGWAGFYCWLIGRFRALETKTRGRGCCAEIHAGEDGAWPGVYAQDVAIGTSKQRAGEP